MKRFVVGVMSAAVLVSMPRAAAAQVKTVSSEMRTETAIVEAIDVPTRAITLKKPDGTFVTIVAGPDITRFSEVKVGDKVSARYYDNVVVRLKRPGEPDVSGTTSVYDAFRTNHARWHQGDAADDHRHDRRSRHERAVVSRSPAPTAGSTHRRCRTRRPSPR